jgi:hypothetical protein
VTTATDVIDKIETEIRMTLMGTGAVTLDQVDEYARPIAERIVAMVRATGETPEKSAAETVVRTALRDLRERCDQADSRLDKLATKCGGGEWTRIRGKQDGVRLVISYIQEAERAL